MRARAIVIALSSTMATLTLLTTISAQTPRKIGDVVSAEAAVASGTHRPRPNERPRFHPIGLLRAGDEVFLNDSISTEKGASLHLQLGANVTLSLRDYSRLSFRETPAELARRLTRGRAQ